MLTIDYRLLYRRVDAHNEANKRKRGEASIRDPIGPQINQGALSLPSFSQAKCGKSGFKVRV